MTLGIVGLSSAFILLALLLLSINLYSRLHWGIKAISIILTSIFYVLTWLSFPPLLGWPTRQSPPPQFRVVAVHVLQPDKEAGTEGAIHLWLSNIKDMRSDAPPRSYAMPYSNELHDIVIGVKAKMDKGIAQLGEFKEPEQGMPEINDETRTTQTSVEIEFYNMPDPLFPEK